MDRRNQRIFRVVEKFEEIKEGSIPFEDSTILRIKSQKFEKEKKKLKKDNRSQSSFNLLSFYTSRSTIHGVKYILDPDLHVIEKIIWLFFVLVSICLTAHVFVTIVTNFQAAPTEVVIESTSYRNSFLPFPSVTICPLDQVDWKKALTLERKFSNDTEIIQLYRDLIGTLSKMPFGQLENLEILEQRQYDKLIDFDVTEVLYKIMPDCKSLFKKCEWRNQPKNCCDIFHIQKTEHGLCYSFNSLVSDNSPKSESDIRKVTAYGARSGLQVSVDLENVLAPPDKYRGNEIDIRPGIFISVNDPLVWPKVVNKIEIGSIANVNVKGISGNASEDVLNLNPGKIPCRLKDLKRNVRYSQETCISECRREHVFQYCGCNPSFYFASANMRSCNVSDLQCLYTNRGKFDNYQSLGDENFQEDTDEIMTCNCPPACDYYNYEVKLLTVPAKSKIISVDVHYEGPTSIRYRMNVVMNGLKLLVHFGGVFGLFVGGSIISLIEIVYIFIIAIFWRYKSYIRARRKKNRGNQCLTPLKICLSDFPERKPNFLSEFHISNERF